MKKRDFETYQKRFPDFEILPKIFETHVFRGTIRHPSYQDAMTKNMKTQILHKSEKKNSKTKTKNERDCMRGKEDLVQISLK